MERKGRGTRVGAGLGGVALAVVLLVLAPAVPAGAVGISVSPSGGLTDGQRVTVSGSGFQPGIQLYVTLCDPTKGAGVACDYAHFSVADVDGGGSFAIGITVTPRFGTTDCTVIQCAVQTSKVGDGADRTQEGTAYVSFAAVAPPPPEPPSPAPDPAPGAGVALPGGGTAGSGTAGGGSTAGSESGASGEPAVDPAVDPAAGDAAAPATSVPKTTPTTARRAGEREAALATVDATDGSGGGAGPVVAGGLVLLLLVAGGVTAVVLRRRRATGASDA